MRCARALLTGGRSSSAQHRSSEQAFAVCVPGTLPARGVRRRGERDQLKGYASVRSGPGGSRIPVPLERLASSVSLSWSALYSSSLSAAAVCACLRLEGGTVVLGGAGSAIASGTGSAEQAAWTRTHRRLCWASTGWLWASELGRARTGAAEAANERLPAGAITLPARAVHGTARSAPSLHRGMHLHASCTRTCYGWICRSPRERLARHFCV